jgi:nucleotide sugar dehydrogenase
MVNARDAAAHANSGAAMQPGTVAVIGMGKIGTPLAAQYLSAGWSVIGVDVLPAHVEALNAGNANLDDEPGVPELIRQGHADGRFEATLSHAQAATRADVVVIIVPLMLDAEKRPDYAAVDAATHDVGRGLRAGSLVIYETTLPIGDTRRRFGPMLEQASGLTVGARAGFLLAFSPERVYSGRVLRDLATYPKLVGGVTADSTTAAAAFYRSVLKADVWELTSAEAAEFAKLAETTYRDVNIALANEFARIADHEVINVTEVIRAANSQPFSHIHDPGLGVGGHCIPVYPRFLLASHPDAAVIALARHINDGQVDHYVSVLESALGGLSGQRVLVLGLTYREGVNELAYTRAVPLIRALRERGARVSAFDPLVSEDVIERQGATVYEWDTPSDATAIVTQTADPLWSTLRTERFPRLRVLVDGRNSLGELELPGPVVYRGVGVSRAKQ